MEGALPPGPYPIFCRGHSGGRVLSEAFVRNGIQMGDVTPEKFDTSWFTVPNPQVHDLVMNSLRYPSLPSAEQAYWQGRTRACIEDYVRSRIAGPGPFGWKLGVTVFMMPMVLDAFPSARVVHLIRDGRDAMLSRLNARMKFESELNRLTVFGDANVSSWRGRPLDERTVAVWRNELEMMHWVTAVRAGLRGRDYGERYHEVRYEDVCADRSARAKRSSTSSTCRSCRRRRLGSRRPSTRRG